MPDIQDINVYMTEDRAYKAPSLLKEQLVTFNYKFCLQPSRDGHSHHEDTAGTFTLFSRSWEIPFKADLCFKLFLFSVFSISFVMTFFSARLVLFVLVVSLCSLSSFSFEATVLSAFSTCHKQKKIWWKMEMTNLWN